MGAHFSNDDYERARKNSSGRKFLQSVWKGVGFDNVDRIEKANRTTEAYGSSYSEVHDVYITSESGTDNGGNNQNWLND
jgi:hypothetical protein